MRSTLQIGVNQQLAITPQLQQALRLLQLSSLELEQEIKNILENNLILEQAEFNPDNKKIEEIKNEEMSEDDQPPIILGASDYSHSTRSKERESFHKVPELTLQEHLRAQMEFSPFSLREKAIGLCLIDAISEDGYLRVPLQEIQETLKLDTQVQVTEIEHVLSYVQQFDPVGVGARNLAECLELQLDALPPHTPWIQEAKQVIREHLTLLSKRNLVELKAALALDEPAVKSVIKLLTSLNPKPGHKISDQKSEYIIPDLTVWKKNGTLKIELNREFLPKIQINPTYAELSKSSIPTTANHIFKAQLKEAKWFLKILKNRNQTLLKVAQKIVEEQNAFFEEGERAMKPLNMQSIAQATGLHESTISRVTTKKYILTPRGTFELKYFFSASLPSKKGTDVSSTAIRSLIRKLIADEFQNAPLSDHKITKLLIARGINIARRTVTKYRESMRILSSSERRQLNFL